MKLKFTLPLLALAVPVFADDAAIIQQGKEAFIMHCARCHGADARGNGPDAKRMTVAPRDITSGRFKFKTTVQSTPPSDKDIADGIIGHGMPGAGMPSFANLEKPVRDSLVAYIKSISPAFKNADAPKAIERPANEHARPDLKKGKEIYTTLQCALCHGENGRANGTSAFTMVDAWGKPIRAANLSQGWTYRGGNKPIDVYHRILAGIDGAPMPSYEGAATHEDIWSLSNYVASLQLETNWSGQIDAVHVKGELPTQANDDAWKAAVRTDINMQDYAYANGKREHLTVNAVSVQALYNEKSLALRIFWDDPVKDDKSPADSLLIAFKPKDFKGDVRGNLHTLYENNDAALNLALWQAGNPQSVGLKTANLAEAARGGWNPSQTVPAAATYDDGRWTLVVTRPIDGDMTGSALIGFSAWDGHNKETGRKHTSSQWIRFHMGPSKAH